MSNGLYNKIASKSVQILLLNPYHELRTATVKFLHKSGYKHIHTCRTIGELHEKLQETHIDWILSTLLEEQTLSMSQYFKNFYNDPKNHKIHVSFLLREKQLPLLPAAFSAGLLSWFDLDRFQETGSIQTEILEFFDRLKIAHENKQHEAFVAGEYFRQYLKKYMIWDELIALEKSLCNNFPIQSANLMALAEAQFLSGHYNQGRLIVKQAQQMSTDSLDPQIEDLLRKFPKALIEKKGTLAERFDVKKIVVVERDDHEMQVLRHSFNRLGLTDVTHYLSFNEAWSEMKNLPQPDIFICEWSKRNGDLSSAQFLQRLRSHGFNSLPFIVMTNRLNTSDAQLINDIHTLHLIQKPLREDHVVMSLSFAIQQAKIPSERKPIEQQIMHCLRSGDRAYAYYLRKMYHSDKSIPVSRKYYVEAVFNYHHRDFTKARNFLIKGIKMSVSEKDKEEIRANLDKTVLLAKCLFRLGDRNLAIQIMEKARDMSPQNIAILMALTEMNYDLGNLPQAGASIQRAETIDAGNNQVIQTGSQSLANMENLTDLITRMNNQAVSFIQNGDFERGVELYASAIKALPAKEVDFLGVVYYNLALAFLRNDNIDPGMDNLRKSMSFSASRVHTKASSLNKKLEDSKALGRKIKFAAFPSGSEADREAHNLLGLMDDLIAHKQISIALRGIYKIEANHKSTALNMEAETEEAA
ncbi:MAG: hypothetical protein NTX25_07475 [Proteobacteria bacterium]|nr:hypothetical protein [Pseudomonadota bacterium]